MSVKKVYFFFCHELIFEHSVIVLLDFQLTACEILADFWLTFVGN